MSELRRFFLPEIQEIDTFYLPEDESKHIVRVLRMELGADLILLDGEGTKLHVKISDAHPKKCQVTVISRQQLCRKKDGFHLALAPTKNMDRLEWMVEKIVEIGAEQLSFIRCERSERVNLKLDRLERVAISAMKQAQHDFKLKINESVGFMDFIEQYPKGCLAHCIEDANKCSISEANFTNLVLIGPEGDFSPKEIQMALDKGYEAIHLGSARLRTETAGMVATTLAIHKK